MANIHAAQKAVRHSVRLRVQNRSAVSALRTSVRRAETLIEGKQLADADVAVLNAVKALDRAADKGIIHANNAARRKSRLMHKLNAAKLGAAAN